jgi:hypothetical protein
MILTHGGDQNFYNYYASDVCNNHFTFKSDITVLAANIAISCKIVTTSSLHIPHQESNFSDQWINFVSTWRIATSQEGDLPHDNGGFMPAVLRCSTFHNYSNYTIWMASQVREIISCNQFLNAIVTAKAM